MREFLREKERAHEARYDAIGNESKEGDEDIEIPLASDTLLDYDESNQNFRHEEMTFMEFHVSDEHALEIGQSSRAMAYIGITDDNGKTTWGAGMDTDIITASIQALFSAVNRMKAGK